MDKLDQLIANFKKINVNTLARMSFSDKSLQENIMNINQKNIQDTGTDLKGNKMKTDLSNHPKYGGRKGFYAKNTEREKKKLTGFSSDIDHVTLTNTGDFWKSKTFKTEQTGFNITADFKKDGKDISESFSKMYPEDKDFKNAILGTNEEIDNNVIIPFLRIDGLINIRKILGI
jgi:hypothetical protein